MLPESAASQAKIVTPAHKIQLARAVAAPPMKATAVQPMGAETRRNRVG
jgi:hypothetical protein